MEISVWGLILQVKLDKLVKPNKAVADYRTEITGITAADLDGITCLLADIQVLCVCFSMIQGTILLHSSESFWCMLQKSMKKLLSNGTILVGHSLNNDLKG